MAAHRGKRRLIFCVLLLAACGWMAAAVYLGEIMLRLPRKPLPMFPSEAGPAESAEISASDGIGLRAWFFPAPGESGGTVILLHGQTDNRAGMLGYAKLFVRHGYNALAPDMRAHGASDGALATYGLREADDVHRWVEWTLAREPGARVYGLGESMGGAILLQSLSVESRFCAVVAEAPYASLREIAYDRLSVRFGGGSWPGRYPLRPILELALVYQRARYGVDLDRVSPEQAVAKSHTPVLLIYGAHDKNTAVRHARSIYQRNPAMVTLWEIPDAGHTGAWGSHPQEFERRILNWFTPGPCR